MNNTLAIPYGWYRLAYGSRIQEGDKFAYISDRCFEPVCTSIGHFHANTDTKGLSDSYIVIRKGEVIINDEVTELVGKLKAAITNAGHTNVKVSITSDVEVKTVKSNTFSA